MSDKQTVLDLVNRLPENASLSEIAHEIEFLAAIREGELQADRGEVVSHDDVKREFTSWIAR
jgi:predicted transcriptional regulator